MNSKAMIEDATRTGVAFLMAGMFQIFNVKLFISKTVNELITGYNDPLLNLGRMADPSKVKSNQFSLLNGVNFINIFISICSYSN